MKSHDIAMALRGAYLSLHRYTKGSLLKFDVTADQFICLVILNEQDGITQHELALNAKSDPKTIRTMLQIMEKRGLVIRKKHPTDGRAFSISITERGRDICTKLMAELKPVRERMVNLFDEKEREILFDFLNRISNKMR